MVYTEPENFYDNWWGNGCEKDKQLEKGFNKIRSNIRRTPQDIITHSSINSSFLCVSTEEHSCPMSKNVIGNKKSMSLLSHN